MKSVAAEDPRSMRRALVARAALISPVLAILWGAACEDDPTQPRIEALLPAKAVAGALIDVVGERFDGTRRFVSFGAIPAEVVLWQAQRARVRVPAGLSGWTVVVVTVDGTPSNTTSFFIEGESSDGGGNS